MLIFRFCLLLALSTFGQGSNGNKCKTLPQQLSFQKTKGDSFDDRSNSNGYLLRGNGGGGHHQNVSTPNGSNGNSTFHQQFHQQQYISKNTGAGIQVTGKTLVALYDYSSRHSRDVSFSKGDVLEVINDR